MFLNPCTQFWNFRFTFFIAVQIPRLAFRLEKQRRNFHQNQEIQISLLTTVSHIFISLKMVPESRNNNLIIEPNAWLILFPIAADRGTMFPYPSTNHE